MELLVMIDAARRASADRITAVMPYFGYARQDRKDQLRVPITAKLVANLLIAVGADRILGIDLHAQQIQVFRHPWGGWIICMPLRDREIFTFHGAGSAHRGLSGSGGLKMAHAYSMMLHAGLAIVGKRRIDDQDVEAMQLVGDVSGRNVVIVDDMTSTAGTLCSAAALDQAKRCGKDCRGDQPLHVDGFGRGVTTVECDRFSRDDGHDAGVDSEGAEHGGPDGIESLGESDFTDPQGGIGFILV